MARQSGTIALLSGLHIIVQIVQCLQHYQVHTMYLLVRYEPVFYDVGVIRSITHFAFCDHTGMYFALVR